MTTQDYINNHKTSTFKKGDRVIMHTCYEAKHYNNKVWTCSTDSYISRARNEMVFLEGFSGAFAVEYLKIIPIQFTKTTTYSDEEVKELVNSIKHTDKVIRYRTMEVLDTNKDIVTYWIQAKMKDKNKYVFVFDGDRAIVLSDKKTANMVCKEFNNSLLKG